MPTPTFFTQNCPICGRSLEVRIEYLGKRVSCSHCRGRFIARDPRIPSVELDETVSVMQRAEQLLQSAGVGRAQIY